MSDQGAGGHQQNLPYRPPSPGPPPPATPQPAQIPLSSYSSLTNWAGGATDLHHQPPPPATPQPPPSPSPPPAIPQPAQSHGVPQSSGSPLANWAGGATNLQATEPASSSNQALPQGEPSSSNPHSAPAPSRLGPVRPGPAEAGPSRLGPAETGSGVYPNLRARKRRPGLPSAKNVALSVFGTRRLRLRERPHPCHTLASGATQEQYFVTAADPAASLATRQMNSAYTTGRWWKRRRLIQGGASAEYLAITVQPPATEFATNKTPAISVRSFINNAHTTALEDSYDFNLILLSNARHKELRGAVLCNTAGQGSYGGWMEPRVGGADIGGLNILQ
ncbi:hypothetical protein Z517_09846 [Fonsecaea pedrosoi CBS 271.37]|uniref:Unplaced genomic scaffold supercont1.6, whole genome shotgun sequence n=1 Tax=Fonsecaea pedrosoi CBS 271.37 TaxID=1442368 RepID=A0A0D2GFL1_9EURO|nr:uncharacterized protein Z517_09846 [Fonsecaea pedrosoi CBS 271.37]KIW77400.1 hypothetical protein Z517_09846 [Fonsecaea pedrosoi CBS 271.37]